jgi:plastocyanin
MGGRSVKSAFLIFSLSLLLVFPVWAGDVTGKVTVTGPEAGNDFSDVVVFLEAADGKKFPPPAGRPSMASKNKTLVPTVVAVMAGQQVEFPNADPIMHNVFSVSKPKNFDLGLYKKGILPKVKFDTPGTIKVYCNIHETMLAFIVVLETPFYAITDKSGAFTIKDVPAGNYQISTWYRYAAKTQKPLEVTAEGKKGVSVTLTKGEELDFD